MSIDVLVKIDEIVTMPEFERVSKKCERFDKHKEMLYTGFMIQNWHKQHSYVADVLKVHRTSIFAKNATFNARLEEPCFANYANEIWKKVNTGEQENECSSSEIS